MGKFNKKDEGVKPTIVNHMGEKAYKPNAEEELVSTVMTTMLSDSYYEKEKDKVNRIKEIHISQHKQHCMSGKKESLGR